MFEYGKSTKDYLYYFQLRDNNQQIILSSTKGYPEEAGCLAVIDSVKKIASDVNLYQVFTGKDNLHYFELGEESHTSIGQSEGYNSSFNRDRGVEHCMQIAPKAGIIKIVPFSKFKLTEF